jgi:hypothetical protein
VVRGEDTWTATHVDFFVNPERWALPLGRLQEDPDPEIDYLWAQWPGKRDQLGPETDYIDWLRKTVG